MAGQSVTTTTNIAVGKDGLWTTIVQKGPAGTATLVRDGAKARRTIKDKTEIIDIKPGARLWENLGPVLISQAIVLYDKAKGGKQTFPLVILPGIAMEASLEFKDQIERSLAGKDLQFERYVYSLPGVDATIWVDSAGKVYFADVPAQHAFYVREGYEALGKSAESDPLLSAPKFEVKVERGVGVPVRDGLKLSTDLYLPQTPARSR